MIKRFSLLSLVIIAVACQPEQPKRYQGMVADSAMVVCAHPVASRIGIDIMRKGGNAVDAAVAVQLALTVAFPEAGNIGGGGFMILREPTGKSVALDFREKAPSRAFRDMYLDSTGNVIDKLSTKGALASGVPGSIDGMIEMHTRYGRLPWKDLVQPAVDLALKGIALTQREADNLNHAQLKLKKYNTVTPHYLLNEWRAGDTLKWTELGHTFERIRDEGRKGFYEGKTADDIVAEMKRSNGIITHDDLKNYHSQWVEPISASYKGYTVISMPPPSSGGITLIQLLKSIEPYPVEKWGHNSAKTIHLYTEAERRSFADRAVHLGDPRFYDIPTSTLTSESYITERMSTFNPDKATRSTDVREGNVMPEHTETTHISIVDKDGMAVSVTTTLNDWFGNYVVVAGSGFFLNNEMDDFSMKPGVPNSYGVTGGLKNEIQPGKTMLSSMTPTIVTKNDSLFMVVGSPGGPRIMTAVFQTIVNVIDFKLGMQEAVDAKRIHSQWLPDAIFPEYGAISKRDSIRLSDMGHSVKTLNDLDKGLTFIGRVDGILVLPNRKLEAGADGKRGDDSAAGY
ncbi:MAG TPA: gamma-glutamyltransferase [Cyclobacteriaceae bacterium]|nr:gamma-glutamyltransferase [Cyclobacteriaceae bacterium]HMV90256.1 gamma-glutamyltransferase [Cyclobacteriaceae bacterium]HMX02701.1 gamma-glutamyltransferase [Cyclobacteriaceae bacterium]HMX51576.1 gamma-glutamyltransferase [Cyclobacteriaceae bacterium]HMY94894.1 gamma-glutamyltransferase [Cyclobacteriaceae bacterium]